MDKTEKRKILGIFCAGRLGKEIYDIAYRINNNGTCWDEIVFIDDFCNESTFYGAPVYKPDCLNCKTDEIEIIIANGTPVERKAIRERVNKLGLKLGILVDPTAIISPTASVGAGTIVTPYSTVSSNAVIKGNVLIQSYVRVGHDIVIGEDSVVSANVGIGGKTTIGAQTYIGMGAVVRDELRIGSNCIVSMGAVVHTDFEDGVTVVGSPARISKRNENGVVFR